MINTGSQPVSFTASSPGDVQIRDELALFDEMQAAFLISRGLVYLTDHSVGNGHRGTIVARNHVEAQHIALRRRQGEKVLGVLAPGFLQSLKDRMQRWRVGRCA